MDTIWILRNINTGRIQVCKTMLVALTLMAKLYPQFKGTKLSDFESAGTSQDEFDFYEFVVGLEKCRISGHYVQQ